MRYWHKLSNRWLFLIKRNCEQPNLPHSATQNPQDIHGVSLRDGVVYVPSFKRMNQELYLYRNQLAAVHYPQDEFRLKHMRQQPIRTIKRLHLILTPYMYFSKSIYSILNISFYKYIANRCQFRARYNRIYK